MRAIKVIILLIILASHLHLSTNAMAQPGTKDNQALDTRQQAIVAISSFTAKGQTEGMQKAFYNGLDAGMSVNEIKEVIVHLYAYCGFPRSISGLNILMEVLEKRKVAGIKDSVGRKATPIKDTGTKYERGKQILEALSGQVQKEPKTGYSAFSPEIDVFLKEHLFADIFERDILSYRDREITTISALVILGGVEPMMQGHMAIALHLGLTEAQLEDVLSVIETTVGKKEADAGRKVLSKLINSRHK